MNREAKKKLTVETRRRELVIATLESVRKHGFKDATINVISEESGLSRGLISHYFHNKEDLLIFSFEYLSQDLDDFHRHVVGSTQGTPLNKLLASAYVPFLRPSTYDEAWLHFWAASRMTPKMREVHTKLWGRYRAYVSRWLQVIAAERNMEIDVRSNTLLFTQLIDGLWVGLVLEDAYGRQECRAVIRNWLCNLFGENPENYPLTPDFDLTGYPTSAPL